MSTRTYPEYKDSGVEWLGQIPAHWETRRIKSIVYEVNHRSKEGNEPLFSLTRARGLVPQADISARGHTAKTLVGYKICHPSEIVMNRMQAWSGMFAEVYEYGLVSPDYAVFNTLFEDNPTYLVHLFRTPLLVEQFAIASKGIGSGFNRLYTDQFGAIPIPLPPPDEQEAIVRFLDVAEGRIRRYIRAKQKLIKLLNEQKQAIIQQAVTRGLNPDAPLKDSGVEWLGEIPAHWEVTKLMHLTSRIGDGLHGTPIYDDNGDYLFINGNNLSDGKIEIRASTRSVSKSEFEKNKILLDDSSLLLSINGTLGNIALYRGEQVILGKSAAYINCNDNIERDFLFYYLQSPEILSYFRRTATGTTILNLSLATLRQLHVSLPPMLEQATIARFLRESLREFTIAQGNLQKNIDLIKEYRTRLIADVVTGKLDVRGLAFALPEEFADDGDTLESDDDFADDDLLDDEAMEEATDGEE